MSLINGLDDIHPSANAGGAELIPLAALLQHPLNASQLPGCQVGLYSPLLY